MDKEGEIKSDVLCEQRPQVEDFVKYITYYKYLGRALLPGKSDFFADAYNVFLGMATVAWCNVFGSPDGNLHW